VALGSEAGASSPEIVNLTPFFFKDVPEPTSFGILALSLGFLVWRRKKGAAKEKYI